MIQIEEHGGSFIGQSGTNLDGSLLISLFAQEIEPTPNNVGDVWIASNKDINISFVEQVPTSADDSDAIVLLSNTELSVDITAILDDDKVSLSTPDKVVLDLTSNQIKQNVSNDKIVIWENAVSRILGNLGITKIYNASSSVWEFENAYYWTGEKWQQISYSDFSPQFITYSGRHRKYDPEGNLSWAFIYGSSKYPNDMVMDASFNTYVATQNGYVEKVDPDGEVVWSKSYGTAIPVITIDSHNIIHAIVGTLVRMLTPDGEEVGSYPSSNVGYNRLVSDSEGFLYSSDGYYSSRGDVKKTDQNGNLVWEVDSHQDTTSLSVGTDGFVYYGNYAGHVNRVDMKTGKKPNSFGWQQQDRDYSVADLAHGQGRHFYIVQRYEIVKGYFSSDWSVSESWYKRISSGGYFLSLAVDPEGFVYASSSNGHIVKVDPDGEVVWHNNLLNSSSQNPYRTEVYPRIGTFPNMW